MLVRVLPGRSLIDQQVFLFRTHYFKACIIVKGNLHCFGRTALHKGSKSVICNQNGCRKVVGSCQNNICVSIGD